MSKNKYIRCFSELSCLPLCQVLDLSGTDVKWNTLEMFIFTNFLFMVKGKGGQELVLKGSEWLRDHLVHVEEHRGKISAPIYRFKMIIS